jgi:uncharacterized membrane protein
MKEKRWQDLIIAVIGIWTFLSPWFLGSVAGLTVAANVAWSLHILGLAIAVVGIAAMVAYRVWEEWVEIVLGLLLLASPWILHFRDFVGLRWNAIIMGLAVALLAASVLLGEQHGEHRPEQHA